MHARVVDAQFRPQRIEPKWQAHWKREKTFRAELDPSRPKYYVLDMFPYPSGDGLHVGASVGIAMFPRHGSTLGELVEAADGAMYAAKRDGVTHRMAGVESSTTVQPPFARVS